MKRILCYGDSNTYGHNPETEKRFAESERWTKLLGELLGPGYHVTEEGLNSRTAAQTPEDEPYLNGLTYLEPCIRSHQPLDLIILMLGSNDMKTCFHMTPEAIAEEMRSLIRTARRVNHEAENGRDDCQILLVSPFYILESIANHPYREYYGDTWGVELSHKLAPYYEKVAREEACAFINAAEYITVSEIDGLHMDRKGHQAFAALMAKEVHKLLG
jgi:lysophospholipase L1-like esterase